MNSQNITQIPMQQSQVQPQKQTHRILIIEDDIAWQNLLIQALKSLDKSLHVDVLNNAQSAMMFLSERQYDLILLDHYLGENSTGVDFWKNCQINNIKTPIVLLTAMSFNEFNDLFRYEHNVPIFCQKMNGYSFIKSVLAFYLNETPTKEDHINPLAAPLSETAKQIESNVSHVEFLLVLMTLVAMVTLIKASFNMSRYSPQKGSISQSVK